MSNALIKRGNGRRDNASGVIPAACSALLPGLGQLLNGDTDKGIGMLVVAGISGASLIGVLPVIGALAGWVYGATWIYSVADGFFEGRKKR